MKRISQIISSIFTPLLVPTYAMILASFLSMLVVLPSKVLWTTIAITFVLTCVIPFAGIIGLYKSGVVNDPGLNSRSERSIPYILIILCYLLSTIKVSAVSNNKTPCHPTLHNGLNFNTYLI